MSKTYCEKKLSQLTKKKYVLFTDRGNTAIEIALKCAKLQKNTLWLQDQGGWITYPQYAKNLKFDWDYLDTDLGILNQTMIKKHADKTSVFLINSLPGYFALQQDMKQIAALCDKQGSLLINDVSGSIGLEQAQYGEIILGSFGRWKPINNEYGGFVATDDKNLFEEMVKINSKKVEDFYDDLKENLEQMPKRLIKLSQKAQLVKKQLKEFNVLHSKSYGYNVIVAFDNDRQKMELLDFCKTYNYEFTLCPRYIRVNRDAISIELKRLTF